jgi:hypothetical protein
MTTKSLRACAALLLCLARAASAADVASLQFTVPAPDPVQAGQTLALQALAVNAGGDSWAAGSYYWYAEIYDMEQVPQSRTKEVTPQEAVAPGAVAAVSVPFDVPDTATGRRLYRVFLIKDGRELLRSDFKAFQIVEKPIPPPPQVEENRVEGNVTLSFKDSSRDGGRNPSGATTINTVGKIKDSSFLINAYLLHETGRMVDPYIMVLNYYAPWGTLYGGDISPTVSPISVSGQGMRGGMLEQRKGSFSWSLAGGQTVGSQSGTQTTNGRYARSLFAGKGAYELTETLSLALNAFLSADETGSLGTDPRGRNFRGPTLKPQRNSGYGASLSWVPRPRLSLSADIEKSDYEAEAGGSSVKDTAWRGELKWERTLFKLRACVQRAGPSFTAFGAPSVIGDRMTYDAAVSLYPVSIYTLSLSGNQFKDNLGGDPLRVTTTQRLLSMGHALQLPAAATLNLSGSLNTARGEPSTSLDNQTLTMGAGLAKAFRRHSFSLGVQTSQFKDKNRIAHDLDTQTLSMSANLSLPRKAMGSLGFARSGTKDKVDGSARTTLSFSPSLAFPVAAGWASQVWGTWLSAKNTSPSYPGDYTTLSLTSELTWTKSARSALTLGLGVNKNSDKYASYRSFTEAVLSTRYSYSFGN